jgi:hypothetical protein
MRKYISGTTWCIWRWTEVDSEYIVRLHVLKTPFGAICLHWLKKPDPEPYLHDHPVSFLSIVLRGGYTEIRGRYNRYGKRFLRFNHIRWWNFIRASRNDVHRIIEVKPRTLTFCLMGPKTREWGFHLHDGRWIGWKRYYAEQRAGKAVR